MISVCICTHDSRKYNLDLMLFSLVHQTYNGELEVLVCDDTSESNLIELICEQYESKLNIKYIKFVGKTHWNFSECRNVLTQKAKYNVLLGFDSDIVYSKESLNIVYHTMTKYNENHNDYACVVSWQNQINLIWSPIFGANFSKIKYSVDVINNIKGTIEKHDTFGLLNLLGKFAYQNILMEKFSDNLSFVILSSGFDDWDYCDKIKSSIIDVHNYFHSFRLTCGACAYDKRNFVEEGIWGHHVGYKGHITAPKIKNTCSIYIPIFCPTWHINHSRIDRI